MKANIKALLLKSLVDADTRKAIYMKVKSPETKAMIKKRIMKKSKGNVVDQWVDFKYWLKIWEASMALTMKEPLKMTKAMFDYPWIFDMLKTNHMATIMTEGRNGTALKAVKMVLLEQTKATVRMLQNIILDPDNTVMIHVMIPNQILQAMDLKVFTMETAANIIGMVDQHASYPYLDAMYNNGLPDNTCTYSTQTPGMFMAGEYPKIAKCMVTTNLPCEAHFEGYSMMSRETGIPTYWLDVPYNFKEKEGLATYVEDLKGMIKFLEEQTGHKMDWDKLREACNRHNALIEMELERWELNRAEVPPMPGDVLWHAHAQAISLDASTVDDVKLYKKLQKMNRKAAFTKEPAIKNIKYKTVLWSTPAFCYAGIWNWLERCWGITVLNDMETFGDFYPIDTTTPESMLEGLAIYWCNGSMARHMRGPAENWIDGLNQITEMYHPDFILNLNHINCRAYLSLSGFFSEWSQKEDMPVCNVDYNFFDTRVVSRQGMRDQINNFMLNIMHATPLDESLLVFDDADEW